MNRSTIPLWFLGAILVSFGAGRATGSTGGGQQKDEGERPSQVAEAVARVSAVGERHALLEPLVGTWDAHLTAWTDASSPPAEFHATMTNAWVLDGRFLRQEYASELDGEPFEGLGYLGFSNLEGIYQQIWMDSRNTAIQYSRLSVSEDGKTWTGKGSETDPVSKLKRPYEDVLQISAENEHTFARTYRDEKGVEVQGFRVRYTRKE